MIDKSAIDPNALHYYRLLKQAGFSAYFVGGSVRDLLLGKHPKDFDIATNATPHQIKRIIPQGRIIGRRFRHVMLERDGGRYEIVTFRGPIVHNDESQEEMDEGVGEDEIVEAQAETESAENGRSGQRRQPDLNQFGNAQQDAIRRDFTINAMFYDPDADELVDYVEGKLDIDRKIIRTIGEPLVRMAEDPIRILRAIRHRMKLGLEYDPALEAAMKEKAPLLEETSKDRIREEFLKVCIDQSLGLFLGEIRRLEIVPYVTPWFSDLSDEEWENATRLWMSFKNTAFTERLAPDMGLALMMTPLLPKLVLEPYKGTLKEGEKNYLPDMKYFLSCEQLRDYYLRNLRISRAQTDHIVRTLFYWSRMTGLWLEQGPPRRIVGRLFQHPPALLAARMSRILLAQTGTEIPQWLNELADYSPGQRRHKQPRDDRGREHRHPSHERSGEERKYERETSREASGSETDQEAETPEESAELEAPAHSMNRLPAPAEPMIWNGPLHAPVLRPSFAEEPVIRWARKNQTARAFRPSGVPNQPTDYAALKANLVTNYKPEFDGSAGKSEDGEPRKHRDGGRRDRNHRRDRNKEHRDQRRHSPREQEMEAGSIAPQLPERPHFDEVDDNIGNRLDADEDSIGNLRQPGEAPAPLAGNYMAVATTPMEEYDEDDNIGNRLDAPPTSGHIGVNGEGVLGGSPQRSHSGGRSGNNRRRRGRRGGRNRNRGGGGHGRSFNSPQ